MRRPHRSSCTHPATLAHLLQSAQVALVLSMFLMPGVVGDRCAAQTSDDVAAPSIVPAVMTPLAPRGGVLIVPLERVGTVTAWPETIPVELGDGRSIVGRVGWIVETPRHATGWTAFRGGQTITAVEPPAGSTASPILLGTLPADASGTMTIAGQVLEPIWIDLPAELAVAPPRSGSRRELKRIAAFDRPDPDSPFEYWRWVLLAHRLGQTPPSVDVYGDLGALVARHQADIWSYALTHLAELSDGVAMECLDLLTSTAKDGDTSFAAWVHDPQQVNTLLSILLDRSRPAQDRLAASVQWADAQPQLLVWVHSAAGPTVELSVINRSGTPTVARMSWVGGDIPIAFEFEPNRLKTVKVTRPLLETAGPLESGPSLPEAIQQELVIATDQQSRTLAFGPRIVGATPPGILISIARSPWSLQDVDQGEMRSVAIDRTAAAQVRRLHGRWEVFMECRRPSDAMPPGPVRMARFDRPGDIQGVEAVTVFLMQGATADQPGGLATAVVSIPEAGTHRVYAGKADATMEVHRRSYDDRWFCRLVLPESWIDPNDPTPVRFGFLRAHGDSVSIDAAPFAIVPWRVAPTGLAIDLMAWDLR